MDMFLKLVLAVVLPTLVAAKVVTDSTEIYGKCHEFDCDNNNACVTIYQHRDRRGWSQCLSFQDTECITLNSWWQAGRVSSVYAEKGCIRLHDNKFCNGDFLEIESHQKQILQTQLSTNDFNDKTKSVSSCARDVSSRSSNTYKKCKTSDCTGRNACATIYENPNFGGSAQCLTFRNTECINLNDWWADSGSRVSSVEPLKTNTCVRLYSDVNCRGNNTEIIYGASDNNRELSQLNFDDKALSVSSCDRDLNASNVECLFRDLHHSRLCQAATFIAKGS